MSVENLFLAANSSAALGWVLLVLLPKLKLTRLVITKGALPLLFAIAYTLIIVLYFAQSEGNFNSLAGVMQLFQNKYAVLAGWLHYLAFDMLIGIWMVENARQLSIPHLYIIPALVLTFFFGPAGFLVYLGTRKLLTMNSAKK